MTGKSVLKPKTIGWTLFFLSLAVFFIYHIWSFGQFENALYQGTVGAVSDRASSTK